MNFLKSTVIVIYKGIYNALMRLVYVFAVIGCLNLVQYTNDERLQYLLLSLCFFYAIRSIVYSVTFSREGLL